MKRIFLACVLLTLAFFVMGGCNGPGGIQDSNSFGSNANSAVISTSNANISNNGNRSNSGIPR